MLTLVRVGRGRPAPSAADLRAAIVRDRQRLRLAPNELHDLAVTGPFHVTVGGEELDEYVVWER